MHGMRPFGALKSRDEALAILLAAAEAPRRSERVPLGAARGRVNALDIQAPIDVPPFDRATMDGYAVRSADTAARKPLKLVGAAHAGRPHAGRIGEGQAVRIATGAPLPEGADSVARVEDTEESDGLVTLTHTVAPGRFVDPAGHDITKGAVVLAAGRRLTPARLGLLASLGLAEVEVTPRPRVALHTSGDELIRPGDPPRPGAIYDSNTVTLTSFLEQAGAAVQAARPLPDDLPTLREAIRQSAAGADLVVTTGGASVGERDLIVDALREEGEVFFHGVSVKPGKPLLAGRIGNAVFVGLPGNPTSALTNAALFLAPLLDKLAGSVEPAKRSSNARLAERVVGEGERYLFLPVRLEAGRAFPTFRGSGALTSLSESDGWIGVAAGETLEPGSLVEVQAW